jgi:hypothetical protein
LRPAVVLPPLKRRRIAKDGPARDQALHVRLGQRFHDRGEPGGDETQRRGMAAIEAAAGGASRARPSPPSP